MPKYPNPDAYGFKKPVTAGPEFNVDGSTHFAGAFAAKFRDIFIKLGNLETRFLADRIASLSIQKPVFIAGLARAGSTLLLEYLSAHQLAGSHRYCDYPFIFTPFWWKRFLDHTPRQAAMPNERSHKDGIMVTADSPETMEEMLWMAFFRSAHDHSVTSVLDAGSSFPAFERFYREHIRKIMYIRNAERFICKNNYNVSRLEYLHNLFPDCRIVIPVRAPESHIASCLKQHCLFCDGARRYPRSVSYLQRAGHFEFGIDRRPINAGNSKAAADIAKLWEDGDEIRGWARYWAHIYGHLADTLERSDALRAAAHVVSFEKICAQPLEQLRQISAHCMLSIDDQVYRSFADTIRVPTYYQHEFSPHDISVIKEETGQTAARFGYG